MPTVTELPVVDASSAPAVAGRNIRLALIGNPNTGKTTLFNRLCGARAKTSNFPGTTTAARIGRAIARPASDRVVQAEVVDLPGLYRLEPRHARIEHLPQRARWAKASTASPTPWSSSSTRAT